MSDGIIIAAENELDKLRVMLRREHIPFENIVEMKDKKYIRDIEFAKSMYGEAWQFSRNQIIYGRKSDKPSDWVIDGIWQYGSYGAKQGMIETYGIKGTDKQHNPRVMTAAEVYTIIKADWEARKKCR